MEHLWAPWRMQFITELRERTGGCVFCELALRMRDEINGADARRPEETRPSRTSRTSQGAADEGNAADAPFISSRPLKGDDRERLILHRGKLCYVLMNKYPYNNGHVMIIPYRHIGSLSSLSNEERAEMMNLTSDSIEVMKMSLEAEGFNCGINAGKLAGAGIVDHVHMHVVPRWTGDNNFMPVIAETRSMPEYLLETYDRLAGGFGKLEA